MILEEGYKVDLSATFKWIPDPNKKSPTNVTDDSNIKPLPPANTDSVAFVKTDIATNTSIYAKIKAPKLGLMVVGSSVAPATGDDVTFIGTSIYFRIWF